MAHKTIFKNQPIPHIWNVSGRVGGRINDCPNLPTDVELVKVLLSKALQDAQVREAAAKVKTPVLVVNQQFDAVVGYWIFRFQDHAGHPIIDGIVSSAKGVSYSPTSAWVISVINVHARRADQKFWETLPQNPSISAQLRAELLVVR